jgi:hypothetical protein
VIRREGELGEVELFQLDLGAFHGLEAQIPEDDQQVVLGLGQRVQVAPRGRDPRRHRQVEGRGVELCPAALEAQRLEAPGEAGLDLILEGVDALADALSILGGHLAHELEDLGEPTLLAQHHGLLVPEGLLVRSSLEASGKILAKQLEGFLDAPGCVHEGAGRSTSPGERGLP